MYARPSNYKTYSQYAQKFAPQNKENIFYEFTSMEDKTDKIRANPDKLVVVDIYATWCGPCKEIVPRLTELADKYKDKVIFFKENIESELCPPGTVTAVPTFQFFYNGQYIPEADSVGADMSALERSINVYLDRLSNDMKKNN